MKQFRNEIAQRLPEVRRFEVTSHVTDGKQKRFLTRMDSDKDGPADGEFTPVMVRMRAPELEIVDTLINAGIAPNRPRRSAGRWPASASGPPTPSFASTPARSSSLRPSSNAGSALTCCPSCPDMRPPTCQAPDRTCPLGHQP